MLKKLKSPCRLALADLDPLPDPWDTLSEEKAIAAHNLQQPSLERMVSLSQKLLPAHRAIAQDLLADELKLKVHLSHSLKDWLDKALALLYWLEMKQNSSGESPLSS